MLFRIPDSFVPRPRSYCDDCLLRAVQRGDSPVSSTSDVADRTDLSNQGVREFLWNLAEDGYLSETQKGGTQLWYLDAAGHRRLGMELCECGTRLYLDG